MEVAITSQLLYIFNFKGCERMVTKRKFISVICCIILTSILIYQSGELLSPDFSGDCINAQKAFDKLPSGSAEVIVYGSSHAWQGFSISEAYNKYGLAVYNYGSNWQHINTTALYFYDSLRTQSPKVAVIECFLAGEALYDTDLNGEILYTRNITFLSEKTNYLKQCFGNKPERYLSYYMPLYTFHDNWANLTKYKFVNPTTVVSIYSQLGYLPSDDITEVDINYSEFDQFPLSDKAKETLDGIVDRCKKEGIEIVFYTAPYKGEYVYCEAMKEYAKENDCAWINLFEKSDEAGIDYKTDFQDIGHLNDSGARKVADYISKFLVENYNLSDIRNVKENEWEKVLH